MIRQQQTLMLSPYAELFVSLLAENPKVSLPQIQARIGHKSNSKVTEAIYLHVTKQRQMQLAERLRMGH